MHRTRHRCLHASGRCDSCSHYRSRLRRLRHRLGRNLRRLLRHEPQRNSTESDGENLGGRLHCQLRPARRHYHAAHENRSCNPRSFHSVRMAGARYLDYDRRDRQPPGEGDGEPRPYHGGNDQKGEDEEDAGERAFRPQPGRQGPEPGAPRTGQTDHGVGRHEARRQPLGLALDVRRRRDVMHPLRVLARSVRGPRRMGGRARRELRRRRFQGSPPFPR